MLHFEFVLLALAAFVATTNSSYDGYKLFEIIPKTQQQVDFLNELSQWDELYDFFVLRKLPNHPAEVMVHRDEIKNFLHKLDHHKLSFKILNENVGSSVEKAFKFNQLMRKKPFNIEGRLSTERFYNHTEINNYIEYLAEKYPARVHVKTVGRSFNERNMKTIRISNGDSNGNKNIIFVDAGLHAREWIGPSAALYVIEQLVENFEQNAEILNSHDVIILPVANPDGYEYSQISEDTRFWRKTRKPYEYNNTICYGSDPNRNFGFHWNEGGSSSEPCSNTYMGPYPFSEPETIIIRDLLHSYKDRGNFYLTIHSYGNYLIYPWGWTSDLPEGVEDLDEIAVIGANAIVNATGVKYVTGSSTRVMYINSGCSDDYALGVGFNISITMELSGYGGGLDGFAPHPFKIDSMVKEAWFGIRAMMTAVAKKYSLDHAEFL